MQEKRQEKIDNEAIQEFIEERSNQLVFRYCFEQVFLQKGKANKKAKDFFSNQELTDRYSVCLLKNKVFLTEALQGFHEDDFEGNFI